MTLVTVAAATASTTSGEFVFITSDTTLRLGKYFGVSPQTWMGLQTEYELRVARYSMEDEPDTRVRQHAA